MALSKSEDEGHPAAKTEFISDSGAPGLKAITPQARAEVVALFPEVLRDDFVPTSARQLPAKGKTIANLVARHKRNNHALVQ